MPSFRCCEQDRKRPRSRVGASLAMRTLIVGRTRMSTSRCIGGLCADGRSVRLLDVNGHNWDVSTTFQIGQEWDFDLVNSAELKPPHVEDVLVRAGSYVGTVSDVRGTILSRVRPWEGSPSLLFDGAVRYTGNNNGFIEAVTPDRSTWFWIPDQPLVLRSDGKHYDYFASVAGSSVVRGFGYVGEPASIQTIPAGTLVRVSLARWWRPDDDQSFPLRCYVQISGWY